MNLVQFRYVRSVVIAGSFSKAARHCDVSQPTISNAISELEAELGGRIFHRTTRYVELTPLGRNIILYIDRVLELLDDMQNKADALLRPEVKQLRVAFSPVVDSTRVMSMFDSFISGESDYHFVYKECGVEELEARLSREKVDVICGIRLTDSTSLSRSTLYWDTLRYLPKGGIENYSGSDKVTLMEVAKETLVFTADLCGLAPVSRELFKRKGLAINEYPGHPLSYPVLQEWSIEGIGAAILPGSRITGDAEKYPVIVTNTGPLMIAVEAVWVKNRHAPEHIRKFTSYLKDASQQTNYVQHVAFL